ncbi:MAG: molybdopterin molybdotransferase MoeA [Acidimicrobiia bacterium]|nr:molybdopterin molybdotransferase MoeA [Acidimicrobiia bacterium]
MKFLGDAQREVLDAMARLDVEQVDVTDAVGRVTAEPCVSSVLVPPFSNSAMDGFALRAADVRETPVALTIIEDVPAGSVPIKPVLSGGATRIMTGAPMPEGADAVVKVEDTRVDADGSVAILVGVEAGANVRAAGGDVGIGDVVVGRGIRLNARHAASLASAGIRPRVSRVPVVVVMSTGDEVVEPHTTDLAPGKIRDTNRVMLVSVLRDLGADVIDFGIVGDDAGELSDAYRRAADAADAVISTGGVSMGDYDYVKQVLGEMGSVEFWKVAMQPAKPFAFGSINGVPLFGLPGNPVSTFVAYEQFVRPALLHMMGAAALFRPRIEAVMGEDISTAVEREVFVRVMLATDADGRFVAVKSGGQDSNVLSALAQAEAFAVVPVGTGSLSAGDPVTLEMFTWDENRGFDG